MSVRHVATQLAYLVFGGLCDPQISSWNTHIEIV